MELKSYVNRYSVLFILSVFIIAGCATKPADTQTASPQPVIEVPDQSQPTTPRETVVAHGQPEAEPDAGPVPGSVASVVKKMEKNPFSLYWREKNSYTFFIGNELNAEYDLDENQLVIEDIGANQGLVCTYDESGELRKVEGQDADAAKDACDKLMFTLDNEMEE